MKLTQQTSSGFAPSTTLLSFSNANEKDDKSQISSEQSTVNSLKSQVANLKSTMANWDAPVTDGFSLIQITDTQYLSDKNPELFNTLTNWIVENSNALNISMVIHTGDIVQNPLNLTNWQNANDAMMQLYNNGVPYCWDAGNHVSSEKQLLPVITMAPGWVGAATPLLMLSLCSKNHIGWQASSTAQVPQYNLAMVTTAPW